MTIDVANDVRAKIKAYIVENLLLGDESGFDDEVSMISAGILDSTAAIELVAFIDEAFGVQLADEEISPENLDSISRIVALVERKTGKA
jgi:acyl carrier protein